MKSSFSLTARFIATDTNLVKKEKARIIHRVPPDGRNVRALSPEGEYSGAREHGIERELDKVVQFEWFGFVRIDCANEEGCGVFYAWVKALY